jgi:hypothetical protein
VRRGAVVVAAFLMAARLAGQGGPHVALSLRASPAAPPDAVVQVTDLLGDEHFLSAMRHGFALYVALTVQLRESRALWDREVDRWVYEYVVQFDPVRNVYRVEDDATTEEMADRAQLDRRLARVTVVSSLRPDRPGRYHYQAVVTARTLSDEDVNDVYAWLRGDADSARARPGLLTRAARKLLVEVAPLPRMTLEARSADFETH